MFNSEQEMVDQNSILLQEYFHMKNSELIYEFKGVYGIPDVVLYNENETISIEYKLRNWQRALKQAYKYRAFSNRAFVFIDEAHEGPAVRSIETFRKYKIGLCSVTSEGIKPHYIPQPLKPYSRSMTRKFISKLEAYV